jgi:hypothetical protein
MVQLISIFSLASFSHQSPSMPPMLDHLAIPPSRFGRSFVDGFDQESMKENGNGKV